jgi:glycosyltransferase involved in cell wall biosynthesis
MKISIITATYNSEKTIYDCIKSIDNQTYNNIEHLIIDGASKDHTLDIVRSLPNSWRITISEPDNGIYDAMNKGIRASTGDVIGILNSDDYFTFDNALKDVMNCFQQRSVDCVFGDINYVSSTEPDKIVRKWRSGKFTQGTFRKGWHPAHPAFYVKRKVFEKYGLFNLDYQLAADFELMLRFLEKVRISNYYLDRAIVNMRLGGATNNSFHNIVKQNYECYKAFKDNNIPVSFVYPLFRLVPKLRQFIRA